MRVLQSFILTATAVLVAGSPVFAATCRDEAARLATEYDLQWPAPPATLESGQLTRSEDPAATEGAVEPPETDSAMVEEPPEEPSEMPTAPETEPSQPSAAIGELTADERTRMEALLLEAVKAEDSGDSEQCFERLNEASVIPGG